MESHCQHWLPDHDGTLTEGLSVAPRTAVDDAH